MVVAGVVLSHAGRQAASRYTAARLSHKQVNDYFHHFLLQLRTTLHHQQPYYVQSSHALH